MKLFYFQLFLLCAVIISCSSFDNISRLDRKNTKEQRKFKILFIGVENGGIMYRTFIFRKNYFFELIEFEETVTSQNKQKYFYGNYTQNGDSLLLVYKNRLDELKIKYLVWDMEKTNVIHRDSNDNRTVFKVKYNP